MLINAPGQLAFALVQASGRADITAKLHAFEVVPYIGALVIVASWGLTWVYVRWANAHYDTEVGAMNE